MSERSRNLALVFDGILAEDGVRRGDLVASTGLSKATVSRLVEELVRLGLVDVAETAATDSRRGRRPASLGVRRDLGQVIGVSLGLQSTAVLALDLAGGELARTQQDTPRWDTRTAAVSWLVDRISEVRTRTRSPLHRVTLAVPARVLDGIELARPPLSFAVLEGSSFARELSRAVGADVRLDSDANMALTGLTAEGLVPEAAGPVLLSMSTVLTVSMRRRDGSTARGTSSAFGDFSLLPFHDPAGDGTLGALLSTSGLAHHAAQRGVELADISELWTRHDLQLAPIRSTFAAALIQAICVVAVMADPPLVVLAGRLVPLVQLLDDEIRRELAQHLPEPPELLVADSTRRHHSASHGAALTGLRAVQQRLSTRLAADDAVLTNPAAAAL